MGWQEEVVSALDVWVAHEGVPAREPRWRPLGRAVRGRKPGEYVVDGRGSDSAKDQPGSRRPIAWGIPNGMPAWRKRGNLVNQLRAVVPTVVSVNVMHQRIVVIDDHTVLFGSLNALSHSHSREVVLTVRGHHLARKVLTHEHAEDFASPPGSRSPGGSASRLPHPPSSLHPPRSAR